MTLDIRWVSLFGDVPAPSINTAVRFWSAITGWTMGEPSGDNAEFLPFRPADGDRYLWLQRVGRPPGSGGWHLDLHVPDRAAAIDAATAAGAEMRREGPGYVALASPGGMPFCLADDDGRARACPRPNGPAGARSLVDQLCIDIPAQLFEAECDFWAKLTGWPRAGSDAAEFDRLTVPTELPVRVLLQRLGSEHADGIRAHADLAADDRFAEVARHIELGATIVRPAEHWTTLRGPAGLLYCITDRDPLRASN